ncbi:MAG: tripartite tricarboxylate transporter substrate binding protein, partial [Betaproteobacteria bacterium]|nr:tripartite tricarboxylate transporter substrate binding protein [Betaproteobacteria bacterium]
MNRPSSRRHFLAASAALATVGVNPAAIAQPTKALRLIVPFPAGGT